MNLTHKNLSPDSSIDVLRHEIKGKNTYYANLLRRTMMSDVPTLAIDAVHIHQNDSTMIDEIIAHRLGLIVLNSVHMINIEEDVVLNLNVTCMDEEMYVTAGMFVSSNEKVYPINPDTIILKLNKWETIKLQGTVKKGTGREHAKWMPVSAIGYNLSVVNEEYLIVLMIESVGSISAKSILEQAQSLIETLEPTGFTKYKTRYLT